MEGEIEKRAVEKMESIGILEKEETMTRRRELSYHQCQAQEKNVVARPWYCCNIVGPPDILLPLPLLVSSLVESLTPLLTFPSTM